MLFRSLQLGTRRARAAALLTFSLPGGVYLYQGDELGLADVEDIPEALLQDPIWSRSGHTVRGRDGCRVPLPWSGETPPYGFSAPGTRTWLPQPDNWQSLSVEAQQRDSGSMLSLHRAALRLRRETPGFRTDDFRWRTGPGGALYFERGDGLRCVVNFGPAELTVDPGWEVLLASTGSVERSLPPDSAVWLRST